MAVSKFDYYFNENDYIGRGHGKKLLEEKIARNKKVRRIFWRTLKSFWIPFLISLFISIPATFIFNLNGSAHFFSNTLYIFSKMFFFSLPLMMWYISEDTKTRNN